MNMNEMNCLTLRNGIIEVTGFKEALQFLTICYHEPGLYIFPDRKSDNDNAIICDLEDDNGQKIIRNEAVIEMLRKLKYSQVFFLYSSHGKSYISI